jgi:hypothetical protein
MILNTPVFDASLKAHIFTFKDAPTFTINLDNPDVDPDLSGNEVLHQTIIEILSDFLKQAARYFSKTLDVTQFQKRLTYVWNKDISIPIQTSSNIQFCTYWILEKVVFYPTRYEIIWSIQTIQPIVADAILAAAPVAAADPPVVKEVEGSEIPLREARSTKEERTKAKQVIRHARLRIALAKLRAERLAEKYYRRYGSFDPPEEGDSSDSDLSIESTNEQTSEV